MASSDNQISPPLGQRSKLYFEDGDITLRSCEGFLFRLHKANLQLACGLFEDMMEAAKDDGATIPLTEPAKVLEPLFSFAYPRTSTSMIHMSLSKCKPIAKAAQKYQVFAAIREMNMKIHLLVSQAKSNTLVGSEKEAFTEELLYLFAYAFEIDERPLARQLALLITPTLDPFLDKKPPIDPEAWNTLTTFAMCRLAYGSRAICTALANYQPPDSRFTSCQQRFQKSVLTIIRLMQQYAADPKSIRDHTEPPSCCSPSTYSYLGGPRCHEEWERLLLRLDRVAMPQDIYRPQIIGSL